MLTDFHVAARVDVLFDREQAVWLSNKLTEFLARTEETK